jgi:hypothetical protein
LEEEEVEVVEVYSKKRPNNGSFFHDKKRKAKNKSWSFFLFKTLAPSRLSTKSMFAMYLFYISR